MDAAERARFEFLQRSVGAGSDQVECSWSEACGVGLVVTGGCAAGATLLSVPRDECLGAMPRAGVAHGTAAAAASALLRPATPAEVATSHFFHRAAPASHFAVSMMACWPARCAGARRAANSCCWARGRAQKADFAAERAALVASGALLAANDDAQFRWARLVVATRAVADEGGDGVARSRRLLLCPLLDVCNHAGRDAASAVVVARGGRVTLVAARALVRGEAVTRCYDGADDEPAELEHRRATRARRFLVPVPGMLAIWITILLNNYAPIID